MTTSSHRGGMSWSGRLLIGLVLILVGAAAAIWTLARYDQAARFLGVAPSSPQRLQPQPVIGTLPVSQDAARSATPPQPAEEARFAVLEARLARVENATQRAQGSAVRADSLLIAFAARRAIEQGVALGYLEPLLLSRFGEAHAAAVGTIVTAARRPVRLSGLIAGYERLGPMLRSRAREGWWAGLKRELGTMIEIRREDQPSAKPDARYERALERLRSGDVDQALAETMRLPAATLPEAQAWIAQARQYVATRRALDEIESASLLSPSPAA